MFIKEHRMLIKEHHDMLNPTGMPQRAKEYNGMPTNEKECKENTK